MIELLDVCYARLGTNDLELSRDFSTKILGLEVVQNGGKDLYLRSDDRAHTLYYHDGDPADHVIGFEVRDSSALDSAGATLEKLGHEFRHGSRDECEARHVADFIAFKDPTGTSVEVVTRPEVKGQRYFPSRDAGITGFSHVGLFSKDPAQDEQFWTQICNARVSDRVGDIPLLRISDIHHTLALIKAPRSGIQHINHQVESVDDIMRAKSLLKQHDVPIVFGPGRHPTSSARFIYFEGPGQMVFEYSVGVKHIDEETYRERQFGFEPASLCMWGSRSSLPGASN